ncbi:MAG TPA: transketolase C-terminal domain-containing protein, partial [Synergistaceae bacterium]|nr:transketolase C-terminal domain-containing protein [Synergistaceae bacterium]
SHKTVLTMEDGFVTGGMGEALAARAGNSLGGGRVFTLGVPDRFIPHATVEEQQSSFGMTAEGLLEAFAHARQA